MIQVHKGIDALRMFVVLIGMERNCKRPRSPAHHFFTSRKVSQWTICKKLKNSLIQSLDIFIRIQFLDKLAYELIFNNSFQISSGFTKRGINEVNNSSSNSKIKKTKKNHNNSSSNSKIKKTKKNHKERDADDDGDEDDNTHRLISFAQKFPDFDKQYSQTVRLNCKQCNTHRTSYFCLDCSEVTRGCNSK